MSRKGKENQSIHRTIGTTQVRKSSKQVMLEFFKPKHSQVVMLSKNRERSGRDSMITVYECDLDKLYKTPRNSGRIERICLDKLNYGSLLQKQQQQSRK